MKAGNFILDLLRTYQDRGTSARNIMAAAGMFKFSENQVRVTLSRLVARGLVENYERGRYRLASTSDPVADFVEEWRNGEDRRRPWKPGTYVLIQLPHADKRSLWVLEATGFLRIAETVWCRPDNLSRAGTELKDFLFELGLQNDSLFVPSATLLPDEEDKLFDDYKIDTLENGYQKMSRRIAESALRLTTLPADAARIESFNLGGEAIELLVKDSLLPDQKQDPAERRNLWQAMIDYDELGRGIWAGKPGVIPIETSKYG